MAGTDPIFAHPTLGRMNEDIEAIEAEIKPEFSPEAWRDFTFDERAAHTAAVISGLTAQKKEEFLTTLKQTEANLAQGKWAGMELLGQANILARIRQLREKLTNPDYTARFDISQDQIVGVSEKKGERQFQEDTVIIDDASDLNGLSQEDQIDILNRTIFALQQRITTDHPEEWQNVGSTLNLSVIQGGQVITANVGDSEAWIFDAPANGEPALGRMNTLHSPEDEEERLLAHFKSAGQVGRYAKQEYKRTKKSDKPTRVGGLAVSRSMGDASHTQFGVISRPDFTISEAPPEGTQRYLINCCDGILEKMSVEKLQDILKQETSKGSSPDVIANVICKAAIEAGSGDNVSCIVRKVDPADQEVRVQAVFDGHGGDQVSQFLQENFMTELRNQVRLAKGQERVAGDAPHSADAEQSAAAASPVAPSVVVVPSPVAASPVAPISAEADGKQEAVSAAVQKQRWVKATPYARPSPPTTTAVGQKPAPQEAIGGSKEPVRGPASTVDPIPAPPTTEPQKDTVNKSLMKRWRTKLRRHQKLSFEEKIKSHKGFRAGAEAETDHLVQDNQYYLRESRDKSQFYLVLPQGPFPITEEKGKLMAGGIALKDAIRGKEALDLAPPSPGQR